MDSSAVIKLPLFEHNCKAASDHGMFQTFKEDASVMLGILFNDKECKELDYVLRKELDEMLLDLGDSRLDEEIKQAITRRYRVVFRMFARIAPSRELSRYALRARNNQ
jgi:hypothetical protein